MKRKYHAGSVGHNREGALKDIVLHQKQQQGKIKRDKGNCYNEMDLLN